MRFPAGGFCVSLEIQIMKRVILVILCVLSFSVRASHIVGGEFELVYKNNFWYTLNLIIYFDEINGLPQNKEQDTTITARIFRTRDNAFMADVQIPFLQETPVNYTQPDCSIGSIKTSRMVYSKDIFLDPNLYNDPQGYYIIWERCCRNYTITNIVSKQPPADIRDYWDAAGQTFYLAFPPVVKDGLPLVNSSPRLFPPLSDYGCPNRLYYADFSGTDDDGDSLSYSIVTPWDTHNHEPYPEIGPLPFPLVRWMPPFNLGNVMGGTPALRINKEGLLTVKPSLQGLFVFAVKCEEFRDGIKIGEVRRDFQMLVVDECPQSAPPQIRGKKLSDTDFTYDGTMDVTFANTVGDEERCIQVEVSDPDTSNPLNGSEEKISIRAIPLNFKKDIAGILPEVTGATLVNGNTQVFNICFPECPYVNGPFQIGIIAYDDACSLPLHDTLKVTVNVQPPVNHAPVFITTLDATVNEGDPIQTYTITAIDTDHDAMVLAAIPVGFRFEEVGMAFQITQQANGTITGELNWDPKCQVYDFTKQSFEIQFIADDFDDCLFNNPVIATGKLKIILPHNVPPVIDADLTTTGDDRVIDDVHVKIFDRLNFAVQATDGDNDLLTLSVEGKGFDLSQYGMIFPEGNGQGMVTTWFDWNVVCDKLDLDKKDEFQLQFIAVDSNNFCRIYQADTLDVVVHVSPPDNMKPDLTISSLNAQHNIMDGHLLTTVGELIQISLTGIDADVIPDKDNLRLELIEATGDHTPPIGFDFSPAEGKGMVQAAFAWLPDCAIFANTMLPFVNDYHFKFRVTDDRCITADADTVGLDITVRDIEASVRAFVPGNIVTPNGDHCNDYFALEGMEAELICGLQEAPDEKVSLPKDNCYSKFESIAIYNRWGKEVFKSTQRNFRWHPGEEANGVYYYLLKFTAREYKGSITVRY